MARARPAAAATLTLILLLAACGGGKDERRNEALASLDSRLTNSAAVEDVTGNTGATFDEASGGNATGDSTGNSSAGVGASLQALASQGAGMATGQRKGCADSLAYDESWAGRMPAPLRPYAGTRLVEAAGVVTARCTLIGLTLTTADSPETLLARYAVAAKAAGYDAERADKGTDLRLGGSKGEDGPAYIILARPRGGAGAEADILYVE